MKFTTSIIALFLILVSCSNNKELKVGFLLPNFTDARYPKDRDFFTAKFKSLGGTVEVGDANNDEKKQEDQAREMIKNGIKVLVITSVNQNTAASIARLAKSHGIKILAYERLIRNADVDYYISFDHYEVGKIQANYVAKNKPGGNYVILCGDKGDYNAELIMKGQMEILNGAGSGSPKIIYKAFVEDWSDENAYMEMRKVLTLSNEKIDAVLTANDGMAGGVIKALQEFQPDYPVITTGLDANLDACKRIVAGTQSMTVYKSFKFEAEMAAEIAFKLAKGEKVTEAKTFTDNGKMQVPSIPLVPTGVSQSNIKSTIVADGFYTEQQLQE